MAEYKLVVTAAGGAGLNVVDKALKYVAGLGEGFAKMEFHFIDTSRNNYDNVDKVGDFYLIQRKTNTNTTIDGSGGDRRKTAEDIILNIPDYLDSINVKKKETGVVHCVVCSTSGGSGSSIGIGVIQQLMKKNIPVFAILIGDSSDDLKMRNTQAVLATLSNMAVTQNKCLLTYYINNNHMGSNLTSNEHIANEKIKNAMSIMSLFLSGQNESIDQADMNNFINQHDYDGIKVPAGIYTISLHDGTKEIELPSYAVPSVARTLTAGNKEVEFNLSVLHHKYGKVVNENALQIFEKSLPIHIVASNGLLKEEVRKLNEGNEASKQKQLDLKNSNIEASSNSIVDEDLGMIF